MRFLAQMNSHHGLGPRCKILAQRTVPCKLWVIFGGSTVCQDSLPDF